LENHTITVSVVAEGDAPEDESLSRWRRHVEGRWKGSILWGWEILEDVIEIARDGSHLGLLTLQIEASPGSPDLQEEHP
jgi:hypothetical protein